MNRPSIGLFLAIVLFCTAAALTYDCNSIIGDCNPAIGTAGVRAAAANPERA